ncbi:Amino acid-binding ACT domain-containing protein [Desulfosarcina cetonica]|uniref:ACT domain-containing protein n=1 Tax=Desulfosarcina cetonica TaxID=90730 RepID=UPI0006D02143|nr:ACT domain-containing protein [Desulfosarcina cetonica]VTR64659.1 Amino acid-binding ACT domain-containing protein [Desulfosarcina cetonica]
MQVEQISVFLENKSGRLSEVTAILSEAKVNIRALALADTSDFGVLRLIVNDTEKARQVLKNNGFTVGKTNVVAVEVADRPGGLHEILTLLHNADLNVEYMYAFVRSSGDNAVMIFRFEKDQEAIRLLQSKGVSVIDGERLCAL